jgi:replicative DNA helicase
MNEQIIYSEEAERALIGSVIIDPPCFNKLDISADSFYKHSHRFIWQAIESLWQKGDNIDYVTLCEELKRSQKLDEIGGQSFIIGMVNACPSSMNAEFYASRVKEDFTRRNLLRHASELAKAAYDPDNDINSEISIHVNKVANTAIIKGGAVPIRNLLSDLHDEILERRANPTDIWGIQTGYPALDRLTGGMQTGETMIISGDSGVGKSMIAMQMAVQMGFHSPGVIYSLEMNGMSVVRRLVSGYSKVYSRQLKTGNINDGEFMPISEAFGKLEKSNVFISDNPEQTTASIRADMDRLKSEHNIKWFIVDYLYLLNDGIGLKENDQTILISRNIKRVARALNLAGVVIHSMNKSGMNSDVPTNSSLRGSGQIIYDADLVAFLINYNSDMDNPDDPIPAQHHKNARLLVFTKGRELEDERKVVRFIKTSGLPYFTEYSQKK